MARIEGLEPHQAGWFARLVYWLARRKIAQETGASRLVEPLKIMAHHPRLLRAYGHMEMGQEAASLVPVSLKVLVSIKAASLIGCPF
jgi:4-carboxymuconolactone decarboxylase